MKKQLKKRKGIDEKNEEEFRDSSISKPKVVDTVLIEHHQTRVARSSSSGGGGGGGGGGSHGGGSF